MRTIHVFQVSYPHVNLSRVSIFVNMIANMLLEDISRVILTETNEKNIAKRHCISMNDFSKQKTKLKIK